MPLKIEVDWKVKDSGPVCVEAVRLSAEAIEHRSKADVAANLNNPGRFVSGTKAKVSKIRGGYSIKVIQRPAFAKVWETGGVSVGRPLLWIPVRGNKTKVRRAKNLIKLPGKRVLVASRGKFKDMVRYIGAASVTHKKRFHLESIAKDEAHKFTERWSRLFQR